MTYIQNLFTSRDNNAQGNAYVGQEGRLWWNPDTNAFYYSDGNTAGGNPITVTPNSNVTFDVVTANTLTSPAGTLNLTGNINISGNISPAASNKIGGIAPGPGVVIGTNGILTIDSANLPVSFGNFFANNNILSIVNVNEDMILATDGNAEIQLIGNVGFYKVDGLPPDTANRYAQFTSDGQVTFLVPTADVLGAMQIVGSTTGNSIPPGITGAMLHITGQLDTPCRVYYDGNSDYVSWVARRYNGNVANPTQVLVNEDVLRINSTAATDAGLGNVGMAQIRMTALENQTTTAQGSSITFTVTPVGSSASARVDVANVTVANGVTATKFTTAGTVIATGNVSGGNLSTAGLVTATANIAGGNLLTTGLISATGNITGGNVAATNYTGKVTHSVRDGGNVTGTTITLNMTTDDLVRCSFANGTTTVAFSNIIPGRIVTLMAVKTDAGVDNINTGISAQNMSNGDASTPVDGLCTAILTYYSLGTTTADIFCSITYL
jgi:hypothetical protein